MIVIVTDEAGAPLRSVALVKLYSETTRAQMWETTRKQSEAEFDSMPAGNYELQASTAGYETATESLEVTSGSQIRVAHVRLKRTNDAEAGQSLGPAAMKNVEKGLALMNSGHWEVAEKQLETAWRLAPTNADLNFLLGLLFEQRQDPERAESYLTKAVSYDPRGVRALTLLGQVRESRSDYAAAVDPLEKAVAVDNNHWMAHWALAWAYFHLQEFPKARDQAETAVRTGKGAANGALVIQGLALARLGHSDEAIAAFGGFLRDQPGDPAAPAVREALANLQAPDAGQSIRPLQTFSPRKHACK